MKLTLNKYVNARIGKASTIAPCEFYRSPGDTIEIEEISIGTEIEGNSIWYKNKNDNCFYWSGGVEKTYPEYINDFGISTLWNETMGEGVKIFVIDSGFKNCDLLGITEKNLFSVIPDSETTDNIGHGTLMANIIGSKDPLDLGIASKSEIFSIKITDKIFPINEVFLLQALNKVTSLLSPDDYCVINLSLTLGLISDPRFDLISDKLLDMMTRNNLAVVASVGNDDLIGEGRKTFPAALNNIISVAGLNAGPEYKRLSSSNYWASITTAAPGDFSNTRLKNLFSKLPIQGSSHAAAVISGIAGLVLSKAKNKKRDIDSSFLNSFIQNASIQKRETAGERIYQYNILDKKNLINQFKTI